MKRKLISILLSIFAMLLLMGAAADTEPAAALLAEEESAASTGAALETEAQFQDPSQGDPQGTDVNPGPIPCRTVPPRTRAPLRVLTLLTTSC